MCFEILSTALNFYSNIGQVGAIVLSHNVSGLIQLQPLSQHLPSRCLLFPRLVQCYVRCSGRESVHLGGRTSPTTAGPGAGSVNGGPSLSPRLLDRPLSNLLKASLNPRASLLGERSSLFCLVFGKLDRPCMPNACRRSPQPRHATPKFLLQCALLVFLLA